MAKEQFFYPETQPLFKKLEQLGQRSSVSRAQAFEDWLTALVCALAAETKEEEYLSMVERHKQGKQGERGIDLMAHMFGELVNAIDQNESDTGKGKTTAIHTICDPDANRHGPPNRAC